MKKARQVATNNSDVSEKAAAPVHKVTAPVRFSRLHLFLAVGGALLCVLIYALRVDQVAGFLQDDGWYIVLAKALASGQGYALINSPTPGIPPLYPPGFPALLSLVFRVAPRFPENLYLLKAVSVLAMFGTGVVSGWYFLRYRELSPGLAIGLATATILAPPFVFFATSTVMSECVFTLLQLLTIVVVERSTQWQGKRQLYYLILGVGLTTATFLTRSMAISLVLAMVLYLIGERQRKALLILGAGLLLLLGPWLLYARTHTPTPTQRWEQGGYIVIGYAEQFWHKIAGGEQLGTISITDLPERIWNTAITIMGRDIGRLTFSPLYSLTGSNDKGILSFLLSIFIILGYVVICRERMTLVEYVVPLSLALTLLWPYDPVRFVLPLTPFLFYYLLRGIKFCFDLMQQKLGEGETPANGQLLVVVTGLFLVLHLYEHTTYLWSKFQTQEDLRPAYIRVFEQNREMLNWVKENTQTDALFAAENPPLVYLYTNCKTVHQGEIRTDWERYEKLGIRYWVRTGRVPNGPVTADERQYRVAYISPGTQGLRVIDLGAPGQRKAWGK